MQKSCCLDKQEYLFEVKESKFLVYSFYVENEEQIASYLSLIKQKENKAKHIVYAYRLLNNQTKFFESTEPKSSSGKKIRDVIFTHNLYNILIIIARYKSNAQLGLSLLTRSYYNAASLVVVNKNICDLKLENIYVLEFDLINLNKYLETLKYHKENIYNKEILEKTAKLVVSLNNSYDYFKNKAKVIFYKSNILRLKIDK